MPTVYLIFPVNYSPNIRELTICSRNAEQAKPSRPIPTGSFWAVAVLRIVRADHGGVFAALDKPGCVWKECGVAN
jgi:hypothetical protein